MLRADESRCYELAKSCAADMEGICSSYILWGTQNKNYTEHKCLTAGHWITKLSPECINDVVSAVLLILEANQNLNRASVI